MQRLQRNPSNSSRDASPLSGEARLWLRIFAEAFSALRESGCSARKRDAYEWIFDPRNDFFIMMCNELGFLPEWVRWKAVEALGRSGWR